MVWRQPFPGPGPRRADHRRGHAASKVALLQEADAIVREEIAAAGLEREIWQSFAVLADIRSVGVMGDERTYGHPIIVRAVTSDDAMTADWARLPVRPAGADVEPHHQRGRRASTGSSTTSRRSRPARSSGSEPPRPSDTSSADVTNVATTRLQPVRNVRLHSPLVMNRPPPSRVARVARRRDRPWPWCPPSCPTPVAPPTRSTTSRPRSQQITDELERLEEQSDILAEDYVTAIDEKNQPRRRGRRRRAAGRRAGGRRRRAARRARPRSPCRRTWAPARTASGRCSATRRQFTDGLQRDQLSRVALSAGTATTDELDQAVADLEDERASLEDKRDAGRGARPSRSTQAKQATEEQKAEYDRGPRRGRGRARPAHPGGGGAPRPRVLRADAGREAAQAAAEQAAAASRRRRRPQQRPSSGRRAVGAAAAAAAAPAAAAAASSGRRGRRRPPPAPAPPIPAGVVARRHGRQRRA